jgi:hypothetical protein
MPLTHLNGGRLWCLPSCCTRRLPDPCFMMEALRTPPHTVRPQAARLNGTLAYFFRRATTAMQTLRSNCLNWGQNNIVSPLHNASSFVKNHGLAGTFLKDLRSPGLPRIAATDRFRTPANPTRPSQDVALHRRFVRDKQKMPRCASMSFVVDLDGVDALESCA